tara:strand:- start:74 stop:556 length:483 start_codon:yes stop_codon:yes gene_type:complete
LLKIIQINTKNKMEISKPNARELEKISGAILTSFINLHYLEECDRTRLFKQKTKNNLRKTISDLKEIEVNYYNKVEEVDENNLADKLITNKMVFLEWLLNKFDFNDFCKIQEICLAYELDKESITESSDKVLENNGAEKVGKEEPTIKYCNENGHYVGEY